MTLSYSVAWFITLGAPWLILGLFMPVPITDILKVGLSPLQGFFNQIEYTAPKDRSAKNIKRANLNWWCQALVKVWKSEGERRRKEGTPSEQRGEAPTVKVERDEEESSNGWNKSRLNSKKQDQVIGSITITSSRQPRLLRQGIRNNINTTKMSIYRGC